MASRKMLVTGAGGMVGSYVPEVFKDYDLVLTNTVEGYIHLDVRHPSDVTRMVADLKPDVILHLAAATDVDQCERDPDEAFHTNAIGTQNIALACQEFDVPLVYVSTAGVFWGDKPEPYNEFDVPRPANVYGQSKLAGEQIVSSLLQHYYIVRAGWMVGGGAKDKKFVGQISRLMMQGTNPLKIVDDKIGSPTYAKDLLGGIHALLETRYYGLYHLVNQGQCSRYDVGLLIRDVLQRPDIEILPVSSAYFPLPAPRARSEAMRNLKLELLGVHQMRDWQEALTEYIVTQLAPTLSTAQ
ncbi:MAG: dTDP-4-dehydrorhamnose reductase [Chloroflexi bacterium]|nr:dTDP-4-dehydrorhamnose reductase [Chloroflexota bacterium]MDA1219303.1 dTDP-4-dehydrorhamnose reductase [Chloroflexota bacterium]